MVFTNYFLIDFAEGQTAAEALHDCFDKNGIPEQGKIFLDEVFAINAAKKDPYASFYDENRNHAAENVGLMRRVLYFIKHKEESLLESVEKDPELKEHFPLAYAFLLDDGENDALVRSVMDMFQNEINELKGLDYTEILKKYPGAEAVRIIKAVRHIKELQGYRDVDAGINYRVGADGKLLIEDIDAEKRRAAAKISPAETFLKKWDIMKIYDFLDETIAGQEDAKTLAAAILYEHIVRIVNPQAGLRKSNYLMYGPTGSGKTEIWRQLRIISPVPVFIMDSSEITMQGYKGNDKEDFFLAFSANALSMEKGIIVLDEFDKLCQRRTNSDGENVGRIVQSELLKMIEGGDLVVDKKIFNTEAITFVCTGVFENLFGTGKDGANGGSKDRANNGSDDRSNEDPKAEEAASAKETNAKGRDAADIMRCLTEYGMLPELAGRISTIVELHELTLDHYYDILCNSKENCIFNLQKKYKLAYNIDLRVTEDAMREIAGTAQTARLGVRAMQGILERTCGKYIMDLLRENGHELTVTKEMISAGA